jgi:hypothetical protein
LPIAMDPGNLDKKGAVRECKTKKARVCIVSNKLNGECPEASDCHSLNQVERSVAVVLGRVAKVTCAARPSAAAR